VLTAPASPQSSNEETTAANLLINGKYREAVPYFTRLIGRQPQDPYHYLNRAECYRHVSEHRAAVQDYSRFIELYPNYPGKRDNVAALLAKAHLKRGQNYAHLAQDSLAIQDGSEAIAWYQKARSVPATEYQKSQSAPPSDVADAYQLRGDSYHNLKQDVRALEEYNQALRLNPRDSYILCNAGLARLALGQEAKARQDFDRALRLDPERKSTIEQMIRFHRQGKFVRLY
jgi:tetratricopeptide (TPR) repeat protein